MSAFTREGGWEYLILSCMQRTYAPRASFLQVSLNRSPPGASARGFLGRSKVFSAHILCFSVPPVTWQTVAPADVKPLSKSILCRPGCRARSRNPEQLEKRSPAASGDFGEEQDK